MKDIPVYRFPGAHARENGELELYRASNKANAACKEAIEKAISEHYYDDVLHKEAVAQVAEKFGYERILYVLAITIRQKDRDERFSTDNRRWAETVPVMENPDPWGTDRNCYLAVNSHSVLVDLFTKLAREDAKAHERESSARGSLKSGQSETANIPVYKQSAEYAIEHDELPTYRESFRVNMACRDALEAAIYESYHDYCLDTGKAAAQVAAQFGMERVAYVLANTVRAFDHDGRISRDNKAWAQTVPVCTDADEWGHERSRYFLVSQVNPDLVNLLVSRVREELAKEKHAPAKRPSVLEKIQKNKTAIQTKTAEKKLPGQER